MNHLLPFSLTLILLLFFSANFGCNGDPNNLYPTSDPVAHVLTVSPSGPFRTVQQAINYVRPGNNQWICIHIQPGIYKEKVTIPKEKPFIFLQGTDPMTTIIQWDDHNTTSTSATFTSFADNTLAKFVTFKNTYGGVSSNLELKQAVAARIYGDKSAFFNCHFVGLQDTLWDVQGRHYFSGCYISGAVDFIFGNGQSIYEGCYIDITLNKYIPEHPYGYITAQGRENRNQTSGFVFKSCTVSGSGKAYLGRAWRPFSRVIFYDSELSDNIVPLGWNAWDFGSHTEVLLSKMERIYYVEENCRGPGADKSHRPPWAPRKIRPRRLQGFVSLTYIDPEGWIPRLPW